ncbi:MAG: glycosyltransferase family 2 protein [Holophagaceae bacterium]|nr:glycosyltransferase family 2 protein [Holophagaceae bacterium]
MKVSIITPTFEREHFAEKLYGCFAAQSFPDKELLVLDDSPEPSPFFTNCGDPRVRYWHQQTRMANGQKRNILAGRATGEVIAHFDDDDYYAPPYIETMVQLLAGHDLISLSGWYLYSLKHRFFGYWDKANPQQEHYELSPEGLRHLMFKGVTPETVFAHVLGYGFTYVYRKQAWEGVSFDDAHHGSDFRFAQALLAQGRDIATFQDQQALVLHTISTNNVSAVFPQYQLPDFLLPMIFGEGIRRYLDVKLPGEQDQP